MRALAMYDSPAPLRQETFDLPTEDGIPLESNWHRLAIALLIELIHAFWHARQDFFAGGNMFLYFSPQQVRNRDFRGPDVFVVKDVDRHRKRDAWIVWEEGGRTPNVVIELSLPSTIEVDHHTKKEIYSHLLNIPEYFCYDPSTRALTGWRLTATSPDYQDILPNDEGWLWSAELELWLGTWQGEFLNEAGTWLRYYTPDGQLVPTLAERQAQLKEVEAQRAATAMQLAEAEALRADAEAQRAAIAMQLAGTEAQRADAEAQRAVMAMQFAGTEAQRADAEAQRAERAEHRLAATEAENARLRALLERQPPSMQAPDEPPPPIVPEAP